MINLWIPFILLFVAFGIVLTITMEVLLSKDERAVKCLQSLRPEN